MSMLYTNRDGCSKHVFLYCIYCRKFDFNLPVVTVSVNKAVERPVLVQRSWWYVAPPPASAASSRLLFSHLAKVCHISQIIVTVHLESGLSNAGKNIWYKWGFTFMALECLKLSFCAGDFQTKYDYRKSFPYIYQAFRISQIISRRVKGFYPIIYTDMVVANQSQEIVCVTWGRVLERKYLWLQVVAEYERAVIFRLGRLRKGGSKGPGIFTVIPCIDTYRCVDLRTVSFDVPPQEVRHFEIWSKNLTVSYFWIDTAMSVSQSND